MDKNYEEIELWAGCTIEHAVNELLEYKRTGVLACGRFNGTTLYSDTVTLDGAYIEITGKTKAELDEDHRKWKEEYERSEREFKESIPHLTEEWKRKGRAILTEDKWNSWDDVVTARLGDLYHGMELGCCLDIVKILNNGGTLDEAKDMIESQGHSGMSYGLVRAMVREFGNRGREFADYTKY